MESVVRAMHIPYRQMILTDEMRQKSLAILAAIESGRQGISVKVDDLLSAA